MKFPAIMQYLSGNRQASLNDKKAYAKDPNALEHRKFNGFITYDYKNWIQVEITHSITYKYAYEQLLKLMPTYVGSVDCKVVEAVS